jgi:hypothetical protein
MIYSGVLTVVFAACALYGFARTPQKMTLGLNDVQGRPRIVMKVAGDGTPSLQMFDSTGNVVGNL